VRSLVLVVLVVSAWAGDLVSDLRDVSVERRLAAVQQILADGSFPDEAVPLLLDGLGEWREGFWIKCREALLLRPAAAVPPIVRQLELDERRGNRGWRGLTAQKRGIKIDILAAAGEAGAPAVPVLRKIAQHDEVLFVRAGAARALWHITGEHKDPVDWLACVLDLAVEHNDEDTVRQVALALKEIGVDAAPAIRSLVRSLDVAPSGSVIRGLGPVAAAEALRAIGPAAIPALVEVLDSTDPQARRLSWQARSVLSSFGAEAVKPLVACLDDPRRLADAVWALGRIGQPADAALPALRRQLVNASKDLRPELEEAIRRIEGR